MVTPDDFESARTMLRLDLGVICDTYGQYLSPELHAEADGVLFDFLLKLGCEDEAKAFRRICQATNWYYDND